VPTSCPLSLCPASHCPGKQHDLVGIGELVPTSCLSSFCPASYAKLGVKMTASDVRKIGLASKHVCAFQLVLHKEQQSVEPRLNTAKRSLFGRSIILPHTRSKPTMMRSSITTITCLLLSLHNNQAFQPLLPVTCAGRLRQPQQAQRQVLPQVVALHAASDDESFSSPAVRTGAKAPIRPPPPKTTMMTTASQQFASAVAKRSDLDKGAAAQMDETIFKFNKTLIDTIYELICFIYPRAMIVTLPASLCSRQWPGFLTLPTYRSCICEKRLANEASAIGCGRITVKPIMSCTTYVFDQAHHDDDDDDDAAMSLCASL
jgi:hypothetical protein